MKQNIIIVDDFHTNPDEVRQFALSTEYPEPHEGYTYPGRNTQIGYYTKEMHEKMESIIGANLIPSDPCGYFRLSLEKDSYQQDIHVDPGHKWGAVLYVNTPDQCIDEGGTSFWRHKSLQWEKSPETIDDAKYWGYQHPKEAWGSTVYGSGLDRDQWDRYMLCPMKYNRLVIFRTDLWHSHNYNFGDSIENGRIVQLFFYNEITSKY